MVVRVVLVTSDVVAAAGACVAAALPQGDPHRVRLAGGRSAAFADELTNVSRRLLAEAGSDIWRGMANESFTRAMNESAPRLEATGDRYRLYAIALNDYARALDEAVQSLPWLSREIGWRRDEVIRARSQPVDDAQDCAAVVRRATLAENELWSWVRRFQLAHNRWADAVDACAANLLRANERDPTRDLHGWAAFRHKAHRTVAWADPVWDFATHPDLHSLSHACDALANGLSALALGLMFVFPPAAGLAFTAAAVVSAIKVGADLTRVGKGESIGTGLLIADAIGALPGGRSIKAAEHLKDAFKASEEAGHLASGLRPLEGLKELPRGLPETRGIEGDGFVLGGPTVVTRKINWMPHAEDPGWGLTERHMKKHFWGDGATEVSLAQHVDPTGSPQVWLEHLQGLAGRPTFKVYGNGVEEIRGRFPRTDGTKTFKLAIRVYDKKDGTYDLVTILTGQ